MTQQQVNESEWHNPENWSHRGLFGLYFSKRDSRVLVPKAHRKLGWTLNLAHVRGALGMVALVLIPVLAIAALLAL